jgi:hypothetical protein
VTDVLSCAGPSGLVSRVDAPRFRSIVDHELPAFRSDREQWLLGKFTPVTPAKTWIPRGDCS